MKKSVIVSGLISGAIMSIVMTVSIIVCYKNPEAMMGIGSMIIGYLSMLVAFSIIFLAVKSFRDKENNGFISFGQAFKIGLFISLIASTIYVLVWVVLYNFVVPDFMEKYSALMISEAERSGDEIAVQQKTAEMASYQEMYKSPLLFTLMTYAEVVPVGLLVSLIAAVVMKCSRKVVPS
jgi:hypothetical protein